MSALFEKLGTRYTQYMIRQGRNQARHVLLSQSDNVLEDLGISRDLLEAGVNAWPWSSAVEQPVPLAIASPNSWLEQRRAIRELRALSDRELQDIGINRGSIVDRVKNGRPGLDTPAVPAATWKNLAKQPVGAAPVDLDDTAANAPLTKSAAA